jgi:hypothetical protein
MGREWEFPEDTEDQFVCPPVAAGAPFTRCSTLDIGSPTADRFLRVGAQARLGIAGFGFMPRIGFSPKITFDFFGEEIGYDFPISFIQSKEGKLNAGLRFKGKLLPEKDDEFSVGIFLGTAFDIAK